jgi:cysteine desulfurase / selenocysteine lyase
MNKPHQVAAGESADGESPASRPPARPPRSPESIRSEFPILSEKVHGRSPLVYLDNASSAQRPQRVLDALQDVYQHHYANVHRGIHWLSEQSTDLYERAREAVQHFIGAQHVQEVIFTSGTTAAINLVARSWGDQNLRAGEEILLSLMEHHSNIVPWQQLAERTGAVVRFLPLTGDGRLQLEALDDYLTGHHQSTETDHRPRAPAGRRGAGGCGAECAA